MISAARAVRLMTSRPLLNSLPNMMSPPVSEARITEGEKPVSPA